MPLHDCPEVFCQRLPVVCWPGGGKILHKQTDFWTVAQHLQHYVDVASGGVEIVEASVCVLLLGQGHHVLQGDSLHYWMHDTDAVFGL